MKLPEAPKTVSNKLSTNSFSAHLLNVAVTLTIGWFAFSGTQGTNDASMLDSAFARIQAQDILIGDLRTQLRQQQEDQQAQQQATNMRILELEALVRVNLNAGDAAIQATINTLPIPYWIKRKQADGTFVMFMINDSYTSQFNVLRDEYIGKRDDQIHPLALAEKYRINDLAVFNSGRSIRSREQALINGEEIPIQVFKFPVNIPSCQQCVGGIAITYEF